MKSRTPLVKRPQVFFFIVAKWSRVPFVLPHFGGWSKKQAVKDYYDSHPETPREHTPSGELKLPARLEVRRFVVAELGTEAAFAVFGAEVKP